MRWFIPTCRKERNMRMRQRRPERILRAHSQSWGRPDSVNTNHLNQSESSPRISVDDVICITEQARDISSRESRRQMLELAQKAVRHESAMQDFSSRPQSVLLGLQAMTSPMPHSAKDKTGHMSHIPTLLPLPSDRTFIPSPDHENSRHLTTPVEELALGERSQSVARQCCEIMGASRCRTCRKLESRMLNREKAEQECPRMRVSQQNIAMTQVVKRFYPLMGENEIQDKIARGEIGKSKFHSSTCQCRRFNNDKDEDYNDETIDKSIEDDAESTLSVSSISRKNETTTQEASDLQLTSANPMYLLTNLKLHLKGRPSTPLFFSNLKTMQGKILSGEVERKSYMKKAKQEVSRLKSAVSTVSTASSGKSGLSKIGFKLTESLMPAFVSPRKVKMVEEPAYKVYFGPPLLAKRKQIPNPSFFAGSTSEYSLPKRLPDIIEFVDSNKIQMMERQVSASSMSMASNVSEETFDCDKSDNRVAHSEVGQDGGDDEAVTMVLGKSVQYTSRPGSTPRMLRVSTEGVLSDHEEVDEHDTDPTHIADKEEVIEVWKGSHEDHVEHKHNGVLSHDEFNDGTENVAARESTRNNDNISLDSSSCVSVNKKDYSEIINSIVPDDGPMNNDTSLNCDVSLLSLENSGPQGAYDCIDTSNIKNSEIFNAEGEQRIGDNVEEQILSDNKTIGDFSQDNDGEEDRQENKDGDSSHEQLFELAKGEETSTKHRSRSVVDGEEEPDLANYVHDPGSLIEAPETHWFNEATPVLSDAMDDDEASRSSGSVYSDDESKSEGFSNT